MLFNPTDEDRLDRLAYQLRSAPAITPELISNVVADACIRLPVLNRAGKAVRIDRLIGAGAWNDAALALIEISAALTVLILLTAITEDILPPRQTYEQCGEVTEDTSRLTCYDHIFRRISAHSQKNVPRMTSCRATECSQSAMTSSRNRKIASSEIELAG